MYEWRSTRAVRERRDGGVHRNECAVLVVGDAQGAREIGSTEGDDDGVEVTGYSHAPVRHGIRIPALSENGAGKDCQTREVHATRFQTH